MIAYVLWRKILLLVTVVDLLHHYFVGHCPFSEVQLMLANTSPREQTRLTKPHITRARGGGG